MLIMQFLVLFILFTSPNLLWLPNTAFALGNETDYSALLKFKESIKNDPLEVLKSWNSSSHFCDWRGVTCGRRHQRVTELKLRGYRMQGSISPHVGNLSFLRFLDLEGNGFSGNVPQELGRLFRLRMLSFENNTLEGVLPISLTNCSELRVLHLQGNRFIGEIPKEIDSLSKLQKLSIRRNNLTGQIPASIGNLSSLSILSISENDLEGRIPEEIGRLKNLTGLAVGVNQLSGNIPSSLYNLSSLIGISFVSNQFIGSLPANMFHTLPNLKLVGLGANQFSGQIPTSITNATRIQLLDISANNLVGQVPSLGKLRDIYILKIFSNKLGSGSSIDLQFLKSLINCSMLNVLDISDNKFGGKFPNFVGNFSTKITVMAFGTNQISGKIPLEIGNLVNLIGLGMEENSLTGIIPSTLGKLKQMQVLTLAVNTLSKEIPTSISNLSQLVKLDLSYNMLNGNIPSAIGNCRNLEYLHLSNNNLSGVIPSQVFTISSLSIRLDLSHNSLSGSLLPEVGMLKSINELDVSENSLSGGIPATIGECLSLTYLSLEGNSFDGSIPPSLASLKGLQTLDLSRNKLSGSIPEGIQNMSVLEYFNASFNMLEGEVPANGVFKNASAVFLANNVKLCGGISELKLPPCPLKDTRDRKHHNLKRKVLIICSVSFLFLLSSTLTIYLIRKRQSKASMNSTILQLPVVSYQNLYHATDGFSSQNLIGAGSTGSVYKGNLESEEKVVAIKVLNLQKKGGHKSFIAECNAFRNVRHRNLVKVFTCCSSTDYKGNDFKALVFEYLSNGSLEEWIHPANEREEQSKKLNLKERLEIVMDVASALHYLHHECQQTIIHCDLKPSNILLDDDMVAHVGDFGLARILSTINDNSNNQTSTNGIKGTIGYAPPEYGMNSQVSTIGDVYSFGILLLEMLTGKRPTDEILKDGHNLHNYVQSAFPNNISEIVDASLLPLENESPAETAQGEHMLSEIAAHLDANVDKCLFSLFKIGLACSVESPRERMNMVEVIKELNTTIRN